MEGRMLRGSAMLQRRRMLRRSELRLVLLLLGCSGPKLTPSVEAPAPPPQTIELELPRGARCGPLQMPAQSVVLGGTGDGNGAPVGSGSGSVAGDSMVEGSENPTPADETGA